MSQVTAGTLNSLLAVTNPYGIEHFGDVSYSAFTRNGDGNLVLSGLPGAADTTEIGINTNSGWGDDPINVTIAAEDGAFAAIVNPLDQAFSVAEQTAHIVQNYLHPDGKEYLNGMEMTEMWRVLQGENLVGLKLENATPWAIIDTLRLACVDYVACVAPFGLRSTLFFGKDWWPYHYAYNRAFFDQTGVQQSIQKVDQAYSLVNPNAEPFFRRRPLLQAHYCHSGVNLIASEIEVSQEGWCTNVQAIGSYAGSLQPETTETSKVQFLDTDIFPEQQRIKLVQSGLYSTSAMRSNEETAALDLGAVIPFVTGGLAGLQTNVLNNYAVGVLHDEVRQMYRGNVYQQGNAWMRPRDLVHFVDAMRQISGPVEVKTVVHSFSPRGGFVTTWSPDCVAYAHDTQKMALFTHALSAMSRFYAVTLGLKAMRKDSLRLRKGISKALKFFGGIDSKIGRRVGAVGNYAVYQTKRIGRNLFDATPGGKKLANYSRNIKNLKTGRQGVVDSDIYRAFENELGIGVGAFRHGGRGKGLTGVGKMSIRGRVIYDVSDKIKAQVLAKTQARILKQHEELLGRPITEDEAVTLSDYVKKIVDKASKGETDADSVFTVLGRLIDPESKNFHQAVVEGLRKNDVVRKAFNRVDKPEVSRATLKVFQDTLGKGNPELKAALGESLGENATLSLGEYITRFEANLKVLKDTRDALKAKNPDVLPNTDEAAAIERADNAVKRQEQALYALKKTQAASGKTATLVRAAGKVAGSEKAMAVTGKIGRGALKVSELLVMAVIGPAITNFNRYILYLHLKGVA